MVLVGEPRPISLEVADTKVFPAEYRELLTTWGPGVAFGTLELFDPTEREGVFVHRQRRYRAHVDYLLAMNPEADIAAAKSAIVIASGAGAAVLVSRTSRKVLTLLGVFLQDWSTWMEALAAIRRSMIRPAPCYTTRPSRREALLRAIRTDDKAGIESSFAAVRDEESVAGMSRIALALVLDPAAQTYRAHIARVLEEAFKHDREKYAQLERSLLDRTAYDHRAAIDRLDDLADPFDLFRGEPDAREIELETAVIAEPTDDNVRRTLRDHYLENGRTYLARLVDDYFEKQLATRLGWMPLSTKECESLVAAWQTAWRTADPAVDVAAVSTEIRALDVTLRRAIVNWIERDQLDRLASEPASRPLLVLALRSSHATTAARALAELSAREAAPFVWSAMTHPLAPDVALAITHRKLGALAPDEVTEVLTWIGNDAIRTKVAFCLLQDHGDDERVLEAALRHLVTGSPFTEKILAERDDPRIEETVWAAFDREEAKVWQEEGKIVAYTKAYGVLSRFLARRGHTRAKEAHQRFQAKLRMDRAVANRIDWEDI